MLVRKIGSLVLVIVSATLLVLIPVLFALNFSFIGSSGLHRILVVVLSEVYFTIFLALLYVGLILRWYDRLIPESDRLAVADYVWMGVGFVSLVLFVAAYSSGVASVFRLTDPILPFLNLKFFYPELNSSIPIGPDLYTFTLWHSFFLMLLSSVFLFQALSRIGLDRKKFGVFIVNFMIAVTFGLLLAKVPLFHIFEEWAVSFLYRTQRNYQGQVNNAGAPYCPSPDYVERQKQKMQEAEEQGRQNFVLVDQYPVPPGVREDIHIIGITNTDIEKHGGWPLDWGIYADLVDRMSEAPGSITMFDISFIDEKGVFGGDNCGELFNCSPIPGRDMVRQDERLQSSIAASNEKVLADYPIYVTRENEAEIRNLEERLAVLDQKSNIRNVQNSEHVAVWAKLPSPPLADIGRELYTMGHANVFVDPATKINRRVPLVLRVQDPELAKRPGYDPDADDKFYPGVALSTAITYFGVDPVRDIEVDFLKGYVKIKNIPERTIQKLNQQALRMEELDIMAEPNADRSVTIPIDHNGFMNINFRGGLYCFRYHEVIDMAREKDLEDFRRDMKGNIGLVAMYYATGVDTAKDIHLSPYGNMAGIEHQAYAINSILNHDFAYDSPAWADLMILIVIAMISALFLPRTPTWMSIALMLLIALIYSGLTIFLSFGVYSLLTVFPTVLVEQVVILLAFILFRVLAEEENVKFIRNTFSKFVSQDVVNELLANPAAITLGGSKKEVSVFFSDVRGFTSISEALGPEELVQLLNEYLSEMTELIIEYRGTIDKYMGDAIMAFWGAPVQNDDHSYSACVAAIAQERALRELQQRWSEREIPVLDIGIGINTGMAVVGNMGSSRRMDYTLMGDTVNLGSRLEGITKTYGVKICISEFTYERVKDRVYARELDLVRVKGKLEPVRIYELRGLKNEEDLDRLKRPRETEGA